MRTPTVILVVLAALILWGCSAVIKARGIEPTDLSAVRPGVLREEVEDLLGPPIEVDVLNGNETAVYEYDMGLAPAESEPWMSHDMRDLCQGYAGILCALVALGAQPYAIQKLYESQTGLLRVVYGPDDTVLAFSTEPELLPIRGSSINRDWPEICRPAHEGDGEARWAVAAHYRSGFLPVSEDYVEAYKWYSLAIDAGYEVARSHRNDLTQEMTQEQLAKAERLVKEWKADPAECEVENYPRTLTH